MFSCFKKQEETLLQLVQQRFSSTHRQNTLVGNILILEKIKMFWCLRFELGKIWNELNRCAKILINQPNAWIFSEWARLHKTDSQLFVAILWGFLTAMSLPFLKKLSWIKSVFYEYHISTITVQSWY